MPPWMSASLRLLYESVRSTYLPTMATRTVSFGFLIATTMRRQRARFGEPVKLNIFTGSPNLARWRRIVVAIKNPKDTVRVAMVGKYVDLTDSYKSLNEALIHGGIANECRVEVTYVDSERIEQEGLPDSVRDADAILVPMGFGPR